MQPMLTHYKVRDVVDDGTAGCQHTIPPPTPLPLVALCKVVEVLGLSALRLWLPHCLGSMVNQGGVSLHKFSQ